ncbi:MAG: CNNM domain-containing protein [Phycisphaerae bacterium]
MLAALDPLPLATAAVAVAAVALSALFSGFETGMYALRPMRLRMRLADPADARARQVQWLVQRREETLVSLLLGTILADYLVAAAAVLLLAHQRPGATRTELSATAIVTPLLFVFGNMVPKALFRGGSDSLVYRFAPLIRALVWLLRGCGLTWCIRQVVAVPARLLRTPSAGEALGSRDAVRAMLLDSTARGGLTPFQAEVADNVLEVASVTLRNVMVPLARVVMVSENYTRPELEALARHFSYASVPVYAVGNRRRVQGVLRIDEGLLAPLERWTVPALMRPALWLPVTTPVLRALTALRERQQVMGIVVDDAGAALGIVTMKDLVEEITGELAAW